ncbi:MAG TPA: penicillin-binding protein 2 [Acidimicrobiales bacterium]|nr:penicillin-binding protein 2 [Acidimicrobiales bacterium]
MTADGTGNGGRRRPGKRGQPHGPQGPSSSGRAPTPRPSIPPQTDEEELADRTRQRVTSSPLKRLEGEEKELQRRSQPVHIGLRLTVMGIVVLGLFSMMLVRLWSLQVLEGPAALKAENQLTTQTIYIAPPRGLILSRNGSVLVANQVMSVVTMNRQDAANDPGLVQRVAVALGTTTSQINADLNDQQDSLYEPVPVAVGVNASTILYLANHRAELPGVTVSYIAERTYPDGDVGAQMLGYVSDITADELKVLAKYGYMPSDVVGQSGIEAQYERFLRGKAGKQVLEVDALGDAVGTQSETSPTPGDDVILNIDEGLQADLQQALASQIATLQASGQPATSGAAVVLDPQTGAVLAMVSDPTYNPEWWVGGMSTAHWNGLQSPSSQYPLVNRAIAGIYQPGSTFKLATATAALQDGLISPWTDINDPGSFTIPGPCSGNCTFINNDGESCGSCDVTTAITMSDDVFFYTLGYDFYADSQNGDKAAAEAIERAAASYGFGRYSDVDLPGEASGQVDGPELRMEQHSLDPSAFPYTYYGPGDALETAFGQGETLVTPLQLANAYATFANGGTLYAPEVAAAVVSPTGRVVKVFKPKVIGHATVSSSTYQAIFSGLTGVIEDSDGTAYRAFTGYAYGKMPLAGKTGTASTSANPSSTNTTALFVAFGPATGAVGAPQYCAAVIIPDAGYGAEAAAPVVRQVFEYLMQYPVPKLDLHPQIAGA